MSTFQIYALIGMSLLAAAIYSLGYMFGKSDGNETGQGVKLASTAKTIRDLEASLRFLRDDHRHMAALCKRIISSQTLRKQDHQNLLAIAATLKLASETFQAFPTAQKQAKESLELRDKALTMAALLDPIALERAA